jgi:hypothetical protein
MISVHENLAGFLVSGVISFRQFFWWCDGPAFLCVFRFVDNLLASDPCRTALQIRMRTHAHTHTQRERERK